MEATLEKAEREMLAAFTEVEAKKQKLVTSTAGSSLDALPELETRASAVGQVGKLDGEKENLVLEIISAALVLLFVLLVFVDLSIQANGLGSDAWTHSYHILEVMFVAVFVAEQTFKIWIFGGRYFRNAFNTLDFVLVACNVVLVGRFLASEDAWTDSGERFYVLLCRLIRLFSLMRLARLIKRSWTWGIEPGEHFDLAVLVSINVYALLVFIDLAQLHPSPAWSALFSVLDAGFITFFMLEQGLKLHVWGARYLQDPINLFDALVVAGSFLSILAGFVGVPGFDPAADPRNSVEHLPFRLLRLIRLLRLLTVMQPKKSSALAFARQDVALQLSCLSLFICSAAIALVTANDALAKVLGGCVSVLSIAYVLLCYYVRGWRRYPNRLLLWKAIADLVTALGVTAFGVLDGWSSAWGEGDGQEQAYCTRFNAAFNPALLQFGFFASEAWGFLLGYDVIQQIRNPLSSSTKLVAASYHALAWGSAAAWTHYTVPLSLADFDWTRLRRDLSACAASGTETCVDNSAEGDLASLAPRRPAINTLPLRCWRDGPIFESGPSWLEPLRPLRDFWWLPTFNLLAIAMVVYTVFKMNANSSEALSFRRAAIRRSAKAIVANLGFWLPLYTCLVLVGFLYPEDNAANCELQFASCAFLAEWPRGDGVLNLVATFQLVLGAQGFFSLLLFSALNRSGIYARAPAGADLSKQSVPSRRDALALHRGATAPGFGVSGLLGRPRAASDEEARAEPPPDPAPAELPDLAQEGFRDPKNNEALRQEVLDTITRIVLEAARAAEQAEKDAEQAAAKTIAAQAAEKAASSEEVEPPKAGRAPSYGHSGPGASAKAAGPTSKSLASLLQLESGTPDDFNDSEDEGEPGTPAQEKYSKVRGSVQQLLPGVTPSIQNRLACLWPLLDWKVLMSLTQLVTMLGLAVSTSMGLCHADCAASVSPPCFLLQLLILVVAIGFAGLRCVRPARRSDMRCWEQSISLLHLALFLGYLVVEHSHHGPLDDKRLPAEYCVSHRSADALLLLAALARLLSLGNTVVNHGWCAILAQDAIRAQPPQVHYEALAPTAFQRIRKTAGMSAAKLEESLHFRRGVGGLKGGRSGAFLFPTADSKLVIKTLRVEPFTDEKSLLVGVAPQMARHFEAHPRSLLARIFGVYSMRLYDQTIYFMIMSSVTAAARGAKPLLRYDLKGSRLNREEKGADASTLKDNNLRSHGLLGRKADATQAPPPARERMPLLLESQERYDVLIAQLHADTQLMDELGVMDYSLFLVVYDEGTCPRDELLSDAERSSLLRPAPSALTPPGGHGRELVVGLIDLTQDWSLKTKVARRVKGLKLWLKGRGRDEMLSSTVPPGLYQRRFMHFVGKELFAPPPALPAERKGLGISKWFSTPASAAEQGGDETAAVAVGGTGWLTKLAVQKGLL